MRVSYVPGMDSLPDNASRSDDDRQATLARAEAFGVDLASLRERLAMTPTERLRKHQQALARAEAFRRAGRS